MWLYIWTTHQRSSIWIIRRAQSWRACCGSLTIYSPGRFHGQSDCRSSVQELDTSKQVEAPPGCSAGHLAGVRYGRSRSICFGKHNSLPIVVCPDGRVQAIEAGRTVTRLARLSSVSFSSNSSVVGNTSQDCSGQTQGTCDSAKVAVQTTVSLAPNLVGEQLPFRNDLLFQLDSHI